MELSDTHFVDSPMVNPIFKVAVNEDPPKPPPESVNPIRPVLALFCLVMKLTEGVSTETTDEIVAVISPVVITMRRVPRAPSELLLNNDVSDNQLEN